MICLASSASNDPVLHFILFVPSASRRPLYILNQEGNQSIHNPSGMYLHLLYQKDPHHLQLHFSYLNGVVLLFSIHLSRRSGIFHPPTSNRYSRHSPPNSWHFWGYQTYQSVFAGFPTIGSIFCQRGSLTPFCGNDPWKMLRVPKIPSGVSLGS